MILNLIRVKVNSIPKSIIKPNSNYIIKSNSRYYTQSNLITRNSTSTFKSNSILITRNYTFKSNSNYSTMVHPQRAIHALSLLNNTEAASIHPSTELVANSPKNTSQDAQAFWLNAAKDIDWIKSPSIAHDGERSWFPDGSLNVSSSCFN